MERKTVKNLTIILKLSLAIALVAFVGCSRNNVIEPQFQSGADRGIFGVPAGPIDSAVFSIYVGNASNQTVTVHRITAPWDEATVTFANFGGAFDPTVYGSYLTSSTGWRHVDVTSLVQGWIDGDYPNYGLLINQTTTAYTVYPSSEFPTQSVRPMLKICYTDGGGAVCETFQEGLNGIVPDAYIWALNPNVNYGSSERLYSGLVGGLQKYSLLHFEFTTEPPPPDSGCTLTIGYWKTHAGFGPQADVVTPLLPIWLGTPGGAESYQVTTAAMAVDFLSQNAYGDQSNGITKLYAQLLGAKLNGENGADLTDVAAVIAAADAFLANNNYLDWEGLSDADKDMVLGWHDMLDDYNNGLIGPIHCED